jgi:hypothetical protein
VVGPSGDTKIGNTAVAPVEKLHVDGNIRAEDGFISPNDGGGVLSKMETFGSNILARTQFRPVTNNKAQGFYMSPNGNSTVLGNSTFFQMFSSDFGSSTVNWETMQLQAGPSQGQCGINMRNNGTGTLRDFNLMVNNSVHMTMTTGGKFGFGTTTPDATVLVDVAGAIGYNGTLTNTSDKRLKKDISKFKYGLSEILELDPISYKYNGKAGTESINTHVGIFAQNLQKVAPELVGEWNYQATEWKYNNDITEGNEFGTRINNPDFKAPETYLNIQESAIKYMLINAVKEQQELISDKEEKISSLEERINKLEEKVGKLLDKNLNNFNDKAIKIETSSLQQNEPNPFNSFTEIQYEAASNAKSVKIQIFDVSGKLIQSSSVPSGKSSIRLDTSTLISGIYFYNLIVNGELIDTKKMTITK